MDTRAKTARAGSRWKWAALVLAISILALGLGWPHGVKILHARYIARAPVSPVGTSSVGDAAILDLDPSGAGPQGPQTETAETVKERADNDEPGRDKKLFVVIATDDLAPPTGPDVAPIGPHMAKNSELVTKMIKRNVPPRNFKIVKVKPESMTRVDVLNTIASIEDVQPEDAILFFGSGHGYYKGDTMETYLTMWRDPDGVAVGKIENAVKAKHARFAAVVVDCCNRLKGELPGLQVPPPPPPPSKISRLFQRLFFEPAGTIVIESSAPGEYATVVPPQGGVAFGSLFARSFDGVMHSPDDDDADVPDWPQICQQAQEDVDDQFSAFFPNGLVIPLGDGRQKTQKTQTIRVWRNGQLMQLPGRP